MTDLDRALRIIEQAGGGDGCPVCGWIWWTDTGEPCLSCERETVAEREG